MLCKGMLLSCPMTLVADYILKYKIYLYETEQKLPGFKLSMYLFRHGTSKLVTKIVWSVFISIFIYISRMLYVCLYENLDVNYFPTPHACV